MGLVLNNNVASLNAQHSLMTTNNNLMRSLERLSTGLKINRGADGPAALVISEKQRAQITGLRQAIENTNKAISVVQTGEGALNEINSLLNKIRRLALDSANSGVNDADSLAANQAEITNALNTITDIANRTQFGSKRLLDGSAGVRVNAAPTGVSVSASPSGGAVSGTYTITVDTAAVRANVSGATTAFTGTQTATLTINGVQISLNASNAGSQVDLVNTINKYTGQTGVVASIDSNTGNTVLASVVYGTQGNFTVTATGPNAANVASLAGTHNNGVDLVLDISGPAGAQTGIVGQGNTVNAMGLSITIGDDPSTPFTTLDATVDGGNIVIENNSLVFHIGANAGQTASISLGDVRASALGKGVAGSQFANLSMINVTTQSGAQDAIRVIDKAISEIANLRGALGAFQANTLESNVNNLKTTLENTVNAESIIRDTDFAQEIANFTKLQTQMQAGATVLGNANQLSQLIAGLLRG
ncbi:MAG: flagellin [Thermogemmata sp.]|nr:flagellin [Thermogemmata sp.]